MRLQRIITTNKTRHKNSPKKGFYYEKRKDFEKELKILTENKNEEKEELLKIASSDGPLFFTNEIQEILDQSRKLLNKKI